MGILNGDFGTVEIYEAKRPAVGDVRMAPRSKTRNERGALAVSKFKAIGRRVWPAT